MRRRSALVFQVLAVSLTWYLSGPSLAMALDLHAFADISFHYAIHDDDDPNENNGAFAVGPLDFYVAESLGPRLDALAEFAFEDGGVDVERLQIGYLFSDLAKLNAGRYHTSLGYWNTAYHHGAFLYTTVNRPFFLDWEDDGGILPLHTVGVVLSGRQFPEFGEWSYHLMFGNGSSIIDENGNNVLDPNTESDPNKNKAVGLHLAWAPAVLNGWALGLTGYNSEVESNGPLLVPPAVAPTLEVSQTIGGVDITHTQGALEVLAEYFLVRDKDKIGSDTATNQFYYVQIAYEVKDGIKPYARHEQGSVDEGDPYMIALGSADKRIETVGINTHIGEQSVLKIEGRFVNDEGADSHQEYGAQWAFAF